MLTFSSLQSIKNVSIIAIYRRNSNKLGKSRNGKISIIISLSLYELTIQSPSTIVHKPPSVSADNQVDAF
jgi:hypothetical protein